MNKMIAALAAVTYLLGLSLPAVCQEPGKKEGAGTATSATKATPGAGTTVPQAIQPTFGLVAGTVSKIDASDRANVKLEIKSDVDGKTHTIYTMPWTNVTKMTDISELKTGDAVRVMTRSAEDKETAMNIMFGDMRRLAGPNPMARPAFPQKRQEGIKK